MKNTLIITIQFLFIICSVFSQAEWNMNKAIPYVEMKVTNALIENDTIVLYGRGFADTIDWHQGVIFVQFDTLGNLLNSNIILDSTDVLAVTEDWGNVISAHDGGYVATAASVWQESAFFIKLDANLKVDFIKEYSDTVNLSNFDYTPLKVKSGYLLFGLIQLPNFKSRAFIRYVDFWGETIWEKFFDLSDETDIWDLAKINDSTFVAAVWHEDRFNRSHQEVVKFDLQEHFEMVWQTEQNPEISTIRELIVTPDEEVIMHGLWRTGLFLGELLYRPYLMKFSADFRNIEWEHFIGEEGSFAGVDNIFDLKLSSDAEIVAAGESGIPFLINNKLPTGRIAKFSTQTGKQYWSIKPYPPFTRSTSNVGDLFGIGELSSGNFIAGGAAIDNEYWGWLVKVTTEGCIDTLFCDTSPIFELNKPNIDIVIFPNPTTNNITVTGNHLENALITLTDLTGRILKIEKLNASREFVLPETAKGLYFLKVETEEGRIVKRVVKN